LILTRIIRGAPGGVAVDARVRLRKASGPQQLKTW